MNNLEAIKAGIFGVVVGDALGVPVEFTSRSERKADPVVDMREYGTHSQPKGTWSDDSSMMLASLDSIIQSGGINYDDMMARFRDWRINGEYTPHGQVFDIGITCSRAINQYRPGVDPTDCGGNGERDNGNGSLMRIMPVSLYDALEEEYWNDTFIEEAAENSHNASRLTHGHPRSQIACLMHTSICHELIYRQDESIYMALWKGIHGTFDFYERMTSSFPWYSEEFKREIDTDVYGRIRDLEAFMNLPDREIKSSGYVVHTLEAAIWCLLTTDSYSECVLKAVNLGDDTDTVGAVAGGLAGLAYGYENIPKEWLDAIVKKDWINKLCENFAYIMS